MWKKLLPGVYGVIGLVVWKRFFGGGGRERKAAREELAKTLRHKLNSMSGHELEQYIAEVFRKTGNKVEILGGPGDQGVNLLVTVGRKRVAVQCKLHAKPVGRAAVSEVYAGAKHRGASQAWLVAPEGLTPAAKELAKSAQVQLFDLAAKGGLL